MLAFFSFFLSFIIILGFAPDIEAASATKVRLSQSNVGLTSSPLWICMSHGFFKKYGLDVEPVYVRNSTIQMMALTTGEVQLSHTGGPPALNALATGYDLKLIATFTHGAYWDIVAKPEIRAPEDLRGKELGVTNIGGTTWIGAILGLEHLKLNPDRDRIKLQALGDQTVLSQALTSGRIDAILVDPSFTRELKKTGFRVLAELSRANIPFASSSLVVSRSYLQQQPDVVEIVLKAFIEATAFIYNPANQDAVLKFFRDRLKISEPASAKESLQDLDKILARKPFPDLEGLRNIQRVLKYYSGVAKVKPEDLIDDSIYRKLQDSGFIESQYQFAKAK
jgi:NitT/TauT family transport system substrate-binding protein